jgi:hypothetical protein
MYKGIQCACDQGKERPPDSLAERLEAPYDPIHETLSRPPGDLAPDCPLGVNYPVRDVGVSDGDTLTVLTAEKRQATESRGLQVGRRIFLPRESQGRRPNPLE